MLVDEINIKVRAGKGGDGAVRFDKAMMGQGPTGGNGGKGGDVYAKGVSDLGTLNKFRFQKEFNAEDGKTGGSDCRDGANGKDLVLSVPVGTVVHNIDTGKDMEVVRIGEQFLIAKGGRGGRGNFHFRSSTNTTPRQFEYGNLGQSFQVYLELKLIADVGLIGLPNVGKSSLLNELTCAKARVANYKFTTLEPHLGVYGELILADIPGLISGASEGKGLGYKFLRHIERTKILFHLVAADSSSPVEDYKTVRRELETYSKELLKRKECVFLSKKDEVAESVIRPLEEKFKKMNIEATPISIIDEGSVALVKDILHQLIAEKQL